MRELRQKRTGLVAEARKILDICEKEKRGMSDAEKAKFDNLHDEIERISRTIDAGQGIREIETELAKPIEKRSGREDYGRGPVSGDEARNLLGAWLAAGPLSGVLRSDMVTQARATLDRLPAEQRVALQEGTNTEGGYTIPSFVQPEVARVVRDAGVVRPISRVIPLLGQSMYVPTLDNPPSVAWYAEEATISDGFASAPFGAGTLEAKKVASVATCSLELLQDSAINLGDFILQTFAESIAAEEDKQALEGATTFTGLYSVSGIGSVSAGGALATLDKLVNALGTLEAVSTQAAENATWVMAPKTWEKIRLLKHPQYSGDTSGNYVVNPLPTAGTPLSLLGKPVRLSNQISITRGAGNDTTIYLGDFRRGMLFGDRMSVNFAVNPYDSAGFKAAQVVMRVMARTGILVSVPAAFVKITGVTVS